MLAGKRFATPRFVQSMVVACLFLSATAAGPASSASTARTAAEQADARIVSGYLDREDSLLCHGGTHLLRNACSGIAAPLRSASLDLDAFLCRSVEATGEQAVSGGAIETFGLRDTFNFCPVDCDADGLHDGCAIRHRLIPDCNDNDGPDRCDIQSGASRDCNRDGVPDECQTVACDLHDGIIMMSLAGPDSITWRPERGYNSFNVYRGDLEALGGNGTAATQASQEEIESIAAQGCDLKTVNLIDDFTPSRGKAIYYLVTGNRLSAEDEASIDSNGSRRSNPRPCAAPVGPLDVSVRTDKPSYARGETVRIKVFLANINSTGEIDLQFATRCRVSYRVEDLDGASIYLELSHRGCSYDENSLTLRPGQIASYDFVWNQSDDRGRPIGLAGNYVIRGLVLHNDPVPDGITGISIRP